MEDEPKPVTGPEPLSPSEHEQALKLEEAKRVVREKGADSDPTSDLPQVHPDDL